MEVNYRTIPDILLDQLANSGNKTAKVQIQISKQVSWLQSEYTVRSCKKQAVSRLTINENHLRF